jgi:hypothetical protein
VLASSALAATCESLRSMSIPNVTITTAELVTPPPPAGRGAPRGGGAATAAPAPAAARGGAAPAGIRTCRTPC